MKMFAPVAAVLALTLCAPIALAQEPFPSTVKETGYDAELVLWTAIHYLTP